MRSRETAHSALFGVASRRRFVHNRVWALEEASVDPYLVTEGENHVPYCTPNDAV